MRHPHYYGNGANKGQIGQSTSVLTRITSGLNSYNPATAIDENMMSNMIDVSPYRDDAVIFGHHSQITKNGTTETAGKGIVRQVLPSDETTAYIDVYYLITALAAGWKIIKYFYTRADSSVGITEFSVTMGSIPSNPIDYPTSSAIFKTEADTYYCFANGHEARLHFVKHTATADTYGYVALPAIPKKMVCHANRIIFIDTGNKLWWCRGGDLYSWYAMEYDPDAIVVSENCGNKALTIHAQPDVTRQITCTITKTDTLDTYGILTVVGTNGLDQAQTGVFTNLAEGLNQLSMAFKTITSATMSGWTQGGASPDTVTVGVAPVGLGYVTQDAGYWTFENEPVLHDMCVLGNAIYIWAAHNIYVFRGTSPDSFSAQRIITDIGIMRYASNYGQSALAVVKNKAFFIYDNEIYEFDGDSSPNILTRPITLHGQNTNGINGGFHLLTPSMWCLGASVDSLYVYTYTAFYAAYYKFDYETRTWWLFSGFTATDLSETAAVYPQYVMSYTKDLVYNFISVNGTTKSFYTSEQLGMTQGTSYPHIITKAYNMLPSSDETLTQIDLMIGATANGSATIELKYSLTTSENDFKTIALYDKYIFTGDVEIVSIPVPQDLVIGVHHYRLQLIIHGDSDLPVTVYNIERRFRTKGRSR